MPRDCPGRRWGRGTARDRPGRRPHRRGSWGSRLRRRRTRARRAGGTEDHPPAGGAVDGGHPEAAVEAGAERCHSRVKVVQRNRAPRYGREQSGPSEGAAQRGSAERWCGERRDCAQIQPARSLDRRSKAAGTVPRPAATPRVCPAPRALQLRACRQLGSHDRPCRRAHEGIHVAVVDARRVRRASEKARHPCLAEDSARAENQDVGRPALSHRRKGVARARVGRSGRRRSESWSGWASRSPRRSHGASHAEQAGGAIGGASSSAARPCAGATRTRPPLPGASVTPRRTGRAAEPTGARLTRAPSTSSSSSVASAAPRQRCAPRPKGR